MLQGSIGLNWWLNLHWKFNSNSLYVWVPSLQGKGFTVKWGFPCVNAPGKWEQLFSQVSQVSPKFIYRWQGLHHLKRVHGDYLCHSLTLRRIQSNRCCLLISKWDHEGKSQNHGPHSSELYQCGDGFTGQSTFSLYWTFYKLFCDVALKTSVSNILHKAI